MANIYVETVETSGGKTTIKRNKINSDVGPANDVVYDDGKICLKSATKTWRLKVNDSGVLSTEEVV